MKDFDYGARHLPFVVQGELAGQTLSAQLPSQTVNDRRDGRIVPIVC
jgi:hypothetical protein